MNVGALPIDALYVVNVRAFVDRRAHIEAQLARFDAQPEFVHDWDAIDLTDAVDAAHFAPGADLSRAQKSCALKHVEAHRRIAARGHRAALVLEDDVVLAERFADGLRAALAERDRHPSPQVIHVGSGGNFFTPRSRRRPGQVLYPADKGRFADAYLLDAATAGVRLAALEAERITRPADNQLDHVDRTHGVTILWLEPPVAEQGSKTGRFASSLEPAPPRLLQALKFAWERLRRKHLYQWWR
jgi:glycosyl transferase family 25